MMWQFSFAFFIKKVEGTNRGGGATPYILFPPS